MCRPIFVLSTGRCGSLAMAKSLNQHSKIKSFHEPMPYRGDLLKNNRRYYLERESGCSGTYLSKPVKVIKEFREESVNEVLNKGFYYAESSHFLSMFSKELLEVFPQAHLICLIRDGRGVARSGMASSWYEDDNNLIYWEAPDGCNDRFSKCCWLWNIKNKLIWEDFKGLPNNQIHIVKLENLSGSNISGLLDKLRIECDKKLKFLHGNKTKKHVFPHYEDWDEEIRKKAEFWMSEMMKEFGYEF